MWPAAAPAHPVSTHGMRRQLASAAAAGAGRQLTAESSLQASPAAASTSNSTNSSSDAHGTNSTGADDASTADGAGASKAQNPWYDQHLPSGGAGWGTGLLYGLFNTSGKLPLDAEGTTDAGEEG